jgi:hypothetical protein
LTADPLVSVVMPSFRQARFLRAAIDSVLDQDYHNLELLVVDGGSDDGTREILASYGGRLQFTSEPDRGQSHAIDKGWQRARGQIVAWLNSDDRYAPGAVRAAVTALAANPDAAMVYGEGELIAEDGSPLGRFRGTRAFDLWQLIHASDFIMQPTVFLRAERLREVGPLDEGLHYAMDWDLWIRIACRWPVAYVPQVLAATREYAATKTARGGWRRLRELQRIALRHAGRAWTPAVVAYGLDTLRRRWPLLFGPASAAAARTLARRPLARCLEPWHALFARAIDRGLATAQGLSEDGWAGPLVHQALPFSDSPGVLRIRGEVPAVPGLFPFELRVVAAGQAARSVLREPGPFEIQLRLPGCAGPPRALDVELRAARSFREPHDRQRRSYRFGSLRFDPERE